jgi:hypothetical protein
LFKSELRTEQTAAVKELVALTFLLAANFAEEFQIFQLEEMEDGIHLNAIPH